MRSRCAPSSNIHGSAWGGEEYAPRPGDYYTMDVLGEPVVIVRGTDGIIRALNTACRHRAMPVVTGRGQ